MCNTTQIRGVSILDHGIRVWNSTLDIIAKRNIHVPDWMDVDKLVTMVNLNDLRTYCIMHDCGKPYCKTVDDMGKIHFPDHASVSASKFSEYYQNSFVERYIKMDMWLHTCSSEDVDKVEVDHDKWLYAGLLLVSFAELYANCKMFGGVQSTSFKIKFKHLVKRGKKLMNKLV